MEITIEQIQKKFEELPEDLRWAIMQANIDDKIIEICKNNSINVDKMGQLSLATHMVMLGFTDAKNFLDLVKDIGIADEKINEIVSEINEKIFSVIRNFYKNSNITENEEPKETPVGMEKFQENIKKLETSAQTIPASKVAQTQESSTPEPTSAFKTPLSKTPSETPEKILENLESKKELDSALSDVEISAPKSKSELGQNTSSPNTPSPKNTDTLTPKTPSESSQSFKFSQPFQTEFKKEDRGAGSEPHPVLAQKFGGPMKAETKKTEYSINTEPNTKNKPVDDLVIKKEDTIPKVAPVAPKIDPYREIPE